MIAAIGKTAALDAASAIRPPQGSLLSSGPQKAGADFADALKSAAADALHGLQGSELTAIRGIEGKADIQTVVDQVMAAERTLSAALAIRNKLISAWQDISHMQI